MTIVEYMMTPPDILHIFPQTYCTKAGLDRDQWYSIENKTPLIYTTNRTTGGAAPPKHLPKVMKEGAIDEEELSARIGSHLFGYDALSPDDFDTYFVDRPSRPLGAIEGTWARRFPTKLPMRR